jgi:hypothetical protein
MVVSKILCLAILAGAATPSVAQESVRDTAAQHHAWARKFAFDQPREVSWPPAPVGLVAASPRAEEAKQCARSELVFDGMPLQQWRAGSCT